MSYMSVRISKMKHQLHKKGKKTSCNYYVFKPYHTSPFFNLLLPHSLTSPKLSIDFNEVLRVRYIHAKRAYYPFQYILVTSCTTTRDQNRSCIKLEFSGKPLSLCPKFNVMIGFLKSQSTLQSTSFYITTVLEESINFHRSNDFQNIIMEEFSQ